MDKNTIADRLKSVEDTLKELKRELAGEASDCQTPGCPYTSPDVPEGYNTVLGYWADTNPESLSLMADPFIAALREGYWLTFVSEARGLEVKAVKAPLALYEAGIRTVLAYPLDLLETRLD